MNQNIKNFSTVPPDDMQGKQTKSPEKQQFEESQLRYTIHYYTLCGGKDAWMQT